MDLDPVTATAGQLAGDSLGLVNAVAMASRHRTWMGAVERREQQREARLLRLAELIDLAAGPGFTRPPPLAS